MRSKKKESTIILALSFIQISAKRVLIGDYLLDSGYEGSKCSGRIGAWILKNRSAPLLKISSPKVCGGLWEGLCSF